MKSQISLSKSAVSRARSCLNHTRFGFHVLKADSQSQHSKPCKSNSILVEAELKLLPIGQPQDLPLRDVHQSRLLGLLQARSSPT